MSEKLDTSIPNEECEGENEVVEDETTKKERKLRIQLELLSSQLKSKEQTIQLVSILYIKHSLSVSDDVSDDFVVGIVKHGDIIPFLIDSLHLPNYPSRIKRHLISSLNEICARDIGAREVRKYNPHKALFSLLSNESLAGSECYCCIGNISSESKKDREKFLRLGILGKLKTILDRRKISVKDLRSLSYCALCFCCKDLKIHLQHSMNTPHFDTLLGILKKLIHYSDEETVDYACEGFRILTDSWTHSYSTQKIQKIIDAEVISRMFDLMKIHEKNSSIQIQVLSLIGNIFTGEDHQAIAITELGAADILARHLKSDALVLKEVLFAFSNLFASCSSDRLAEICCNHFGIMSSIIEHLNSESRVIQTNAAYCFLNLVLNGDTELLSQLLDKNFFSNLLPKKLVDKGEPLKVVMRGILELLKRGNVEEEDEEDEEENLFVGLCVENGLVEKMEGLLESDNDVVKGRVKEIFERFFPRKEVTVE